MQGKRELRKGTPSVTGSPRADGAQNSMTNWEFFKPYVKNREDTFFLKPNCELAPTKKGSPIAEGFCCFLFPVGTKTKPPLSANCSVGIIEFISSFVLGSSDGLEQRFFFWKRTLNGDDVTTSSLSRK